MDQAKLVDLKRRVTYALMLAAKFTADERRFVLDCLDASTTTVRVVEVASPPNYLGRIDAIWAALSIDEGGEGICAAPFGDMTLPLIAADKTRFDQIKPVARQIATMFNKPVRMAKFTKREDVEIYQP